MKRTKKCPKWLPGRYVRARSGSVAYVRVTNQRNRKGEHLVRLVWEGASSEQLWTIPELKASGARFYKRQPNPKTQDQGD